MKVWKVTRRSLLTGVGGVAAVAGGTGLWLGIGKLNTLRYRIAAERPEYPYSPSAYLAIESDGSIVIWLTKSEMGQGVSTALPMIIAEELDADWQRVRVVQAIASSDIDYGSMFTAASSSITSQWTMLRRAGATARDMLINAAAGLWDVPASECDAQTGKVLHLKSGRLADFGELADLASRQWPPLRPTLKDPSKFKLIGQSITRVDLLDKVTGAAIYGSDVELPGILRAVVARPPGFGHTLAAVDSAQTQAVPGVESVIEISSGIAVVAQTHYAALSGLKKLNVTWKPPESEVISNTDIDLQLTAGLSAQATAVSRTEGTPKPASAAADRSHSAEYHVPYLAHVCMEPMNCTVQITADGCELWLPSQDPDGARRTAAEVAGLPLDKVVVNTTMLGGGFGRRAQQDFVAETVELSKRLTQPVQISWSREDDIRNAQYRPAASIRLTASWDDSKRPVHWTHRISCAVDSVIPPGTSSPLATMGADDMPYDIPNVVVDWTAVQLPIPTTIWRSVGHSFNVFAIECFIDELAFNIDLDPLEFRLKLLARQSILRNCLNTVAEMSDWRSSVPRHLGVAAHLFGNTAVAQIIEVSANPDRQFQIDRVWCAVDCGIAINPDSVVSQIEGGIVDGLSAALYGGLRIRDNIIQQSNFHDYKLMRMPEAPQISVTIVPNQRHPSGIGEASLPGAAPALANALYSLTGERVHRLPIQPL